MIIKDNLHLTYCTNIHAGETWGEVFQSLKTYIPAIKKNIAPQLPFGIGLRLSNQSALALENEKELDSLKSWLSEENCYVFTMNGFPYGGFHHQKVKDKVHQPDWTTQQRSDYTVLLFEILAELLPEGIEGGISTSPLSYKPWYNKNPQKKEKVFRSSIKNILEVLDELVFFDMEMGKKMHLDIEPEPDGLLENTEEVLDFYQQKLVPEGIKYLKKAYHLSPDKAEEAIKTHIQICYDVCHFAVGYENHAIALQKFKEAGIKIGKFQISAALKADLLGDEAKRKLIFDEFKAFNESTYLHQVVARSAANQLIHYKDLPFALENTHKTEEIEWRTHFHVPIFLKNYQQLQSTQEDILEVLNLIKKEQHSHHLEVETYTWEVLPKALQSDLRASIQRELEWLIKQLN